MTIETFTAKCKKEFPNYIHGMSFIPVGSTVQCIFITRDTLSKIILASLEDGSFIAW